MDVCTATRTIESMIYKPGWTFQVCDHTGRFQNTITLRVSFPAPDFDIAHAPDYAHLVRPSAAFPIQLDPCWTEDDLLFEVIGILTRIENHEMREALRVRRRGEWYAPFHPHNRCSMREWSRRTGIPVEADLLYGVT